MPPAAISRSSMYLPKICGNMGRSKVSAKALAVLLAGCARDPIAGPEIAIVAHPLERCKLPDEQAQLELNALGDFDASERTSDFVTSDQPGAALAFPPETLAVSAELSFPRSSQRFAAIGPYRKGDELPLLLWPNGRTCELGDPHDYPAPNGGQGLGTSTEHGLVMLAGSDRGQSSAVSGALVFDTGTGRTRTLAGDAQLWRPRAFASVTAFGPGFLVAGGEDPTTAFSTGRRLHDTAEVFVADDLRFDPSLEIQLLLGPRSRHAAVQLSATQTLLIGGRTADSGDPVATATLELIDSTAGSSRYVGQLTAARISPKALLLDDGRVFVAGGYDDENRLVAGADWIIRSDDGDFETIASSEDAFPPRFDQDFVAMPGGGVLAVGGCEDREGSADECRPCRRGCPPAAGWDAFWIDAERVAVAFELNRPAPRPRLLPAPDGAPYLVPEAGARGFEAGDATLRFDPWDQRFTTVAPLEQPPELDLPMTQLDTGAAVWVTDAISDSALVGRRFSTRNVFAQDLELITLVSSTNARWPLHLAPGHGADENRYARLVPREDGPGSTFVLEVSGGASVWLTDARFADFSLEVTLDRGEAVELLVDRPGGACRWPEAGPRPTTLRAERSATRLTLVAGGAEAVCDVPTTRVLLGLGAPSEPVQLSRLTVRRDAR